MQSRRIVSLAPCSVIFVLFLGLLSGCGGKKVVPGPVAQHSPEWVNKGSGAFKESGRGVFYGVGIAQGIRNRALSQTAADERARAEIAKIMNSYVTVLYKDFMESTTAGDMDKSSEGQRITSTLKNFAKFTLHGATIIDHWKDPADGTMFALCRLDMTSIQKSLEQSKELDKTVRDYVKKNAEKAFDELAAEEGRN